MSSPRRIAMLVNIPAPYRVPVYDRVAARLGSAFRVIYMAGREADRRWDIPPMQHEHVFLRGITITHKARDIHFRTGVWRELTRHRPHVIATGGFNPPMLAAWLYARISGAAHVTMTDGWIGSEAHLSSLHRRIRRRVYATSSAFVGASEKSLELYRSYGVRDHLVRVPLGIDNDAFARASQPLAERPYDLVFAGNLIPRKLPLFFVDVIAELAKLRSRVSVLVIGDGELRQPMTDALARLRGVHATFTGFLQQRELPDAYARGKVLCFPTANDPWGVVANEACASGMPVITCSNAGCADELVRHEENGYVLALDPTAWAARCSALLDDAGRLEAMGRRSAELVRPYSHDDAAEAMLAALLER